MHLTTPILREVNILIISSIDCPYILSENKSLLIISLKVQRHLAFKVCKSTPVFSQPLSHKVILG